MVIDRTGSIECLGGLLRDTSLFPDRQGDIPLRTIVIADPQRILVPHIAEPVMVHHVHDHAGNILETPDQMFRLPPVLRQVRGILQIIAEIFDMRQRQGSEHAAFRSISVIPRRICKNSGGETVIPADQEIRAELPGRPDHMVDSLGGTKVSVLRAASNQRPEMNLFAIEVKIASVDGKLPETEFLRQKTVENLTFGGKQLHIGDVKILRNVDIPKFRIIPEAAEGMADIFPFFDGK